MAHIGPSVEYALHCLLWLAGDADLQPSSRDLADLQGVSPSFLAKVFPRLERAGIVASAVGLRGGYRLARAASAISVLQVVDAVEGQRALFECQEIRSRCAVFGPSAPRWATRGVCGIHAVMLRAEQVLRDELARTSLADLAAGVEAKMPAAFPAEVQVWFEGRVGRRLEARGAAAATRRTPARKPRSRVPARKKESP